MKQIASALLIALTLGTAAQAGVPAVTLPDLKFPTISPNDPTQGCQTPLAFCK